MEKEQLLETDDGTDRSAGCTPPRFFVIPFEREPGSML